jgi:hypothetical protein
LLEVFADHARLGTGEHFTADIDAVHPGLRRVERQAEPCSHANLENALPRMATHALDDAASARLQEGAEIQIVTARVAPAGPLDRLDVYARTFPAIFEVHRAQDAIILATTLEKSGSQATSAKGGRERSGQGRKGTAGRAAGTALFLAGEEADHIARDEGRPLRPEVCEQGRAA